VDVARGEHRLGLFLPVDVPQSILDSSLAVVEPALAFGNFLLASDGLLVFPVTHPKCLLANKGCVFVTCFYAQKHEHFEYFFTRSSQQPIKTRLIKD